jgi:hypothetical protein
MASVFDSKYWNSDVFQKYLETIPRVKQNALLSSGVLRNRSDLKSLLVDQVGGNYINVPIVGRIGGDVLNYDGNTDITATGIGTFLQSMIVFGRAKAWQEKDFTQDITGKNFMEEIASQVATYWDDVDETDLLAVLSGIFGVTDSNFSTDHTLDITAAAGTGSVVGPTTLNNAIQKAAGANKNIFSLAIMHSQVATNLENQQLLEYWKQTDANGIQKQLNLASWNGRTVLIDDDLVDTSGSDPVYTTYILGRNAIDFCDCGAKVPNETKRDELTDGGIDMLITRQRHLLAPVGFSYTDTTKVSPMASDLATSANWALVTDTAGTGYFPTKAIPIARIKSLG